MYSTSWCNRDEILAVEGRRLVGLSGIRRPVSRCSRLSLANAPAASAPRPRRKMSAVISRRRDRQAAEGHGLKHHGEAADGARRGNLGT